MDLNCFDSKFLSDLELIISNEQIDQFTLLKSVIEIVFCLVKQLSLIPSLFSNIKHELDQNMNQIIKCIQDETKILKENQENIQSQTSQVHFHYTNIKNEIDQNMNKTLQYFQEEIETLKTNQQLIKEQINDNRNLIKFPHLLEKPKDYESDIFKACEEGKLSSVQWLIEIEKVDKNKIKNNGLYLIFGRNDSPIHIASKHGHLPIVQYLIEKQNVDINIRGKYFWPPLTCACKWGHLPVVEYLVSKGADVNIKDWSPLHVAAHNGHTDIVKYLISKGANINAKIANGKTPYDVAANDEIRNILK